MRLADGRSRVSRQKGNCEGEECEVFPISGGSDHCDQPRGFLTSWVGIQVSNNQLLSTGVTGMLVGVGVGTCNGVRASSQITSRSKSWSREGSRVTVI